MPCVAHRGWSSAAPENTIAAFELVLQQPLISWIELDVQITKDGIPVVIHDSTLQRTTTGRGRVKDHTYEQLLRYDAGRWYSMAYEGQQIPRLEDVFRLVKTRCKLNIEIKTSLQVYPQMAARIVELIDRYDMYKEVCVTSFELDTLAAIRRLNPHVETGLIVSSRMFLLRHKLRKLGATYASMKYSLLTAASYQKLVASGHRVIAWTINQPEEMRRYMQMDPDMMICTDYPERWLKLKNSKL